MNGLVIAVNRSKNHIFTKPTQNRIQLLAGQNGDHGDRVGRVRGKTGRSQPYKAALRTPSAT